MEFLPILYVIAVIIGGGLILLSLFLSGDGSVDHSADVSPDTTFESDLGQEMQHDIGHGHMATHPLALSNWFSSQFVVYFLAVFGLIGSTLTFLSQTRPLICFFWALGGGLMVGQVAHQVLRALKRSSIGSDLSIDDYVNQSARVTMAVESKRRGEVAIASRNGERFVAALARRSDDRFKVGDTVVVTAFCNGVAEVISKQEFDFLANKS